MDVILLSNDVVPGAELPVAAPGLRQWGLAHGLRAHGLDVELVVPRHVADRMWGDAPGPAPRDATVLAAGQIPELVRSRAPSVVVMTNSNQHEAVRGIDGTRYVYDFFAPKVLELVCQSGTELDEERLTALRRRKIEALSEADAVIVNGEKKLPYVLAWLLQTGRDVNRLPVLPVPMCLPASDREPRRPATPLRVGIAGYLQAWSQPGPWLDRVREAVDAGQIELHLLLPPHWGGRGDVDRSSSLERLARSENVVHHSPKTFEAFVDFLSDMDLVLDLFDWSLEREYAMVTRTVVALTAGRPVVHPPFTEVAPMIEAAGAGWLLDVADPDLGDRLAAIFDDPDEVARRGERAREVAATSFDPAHAVTPLVDLISSWDS